MGVADLLFVLNKCWEYSDKSIALQIFALRRSASEEQAKKSFLIINLNQAECGISFHSAKPPGEPKQGTLSALIRKYLIRAHITAIYAESQSGDLWIALRQPPDAAECWYLYLAKSQKPPLLSLINPLGLSLVRISSAATYTKAHPHPGTLPDFKSGGFELLALDSSDKKSQTTKPPAAAASAETSKVAGAQKVLRDRLKRKLKTLKNSLNKMQAQIPSEEELVRLASEAELLKAYLHLVEKEAKALVLTPDLTGLAAEITIALDENLSASQNLQRAFTRLKKGKTAFEIQNKLAAKLKAEIAALSFDIEKLEEHTLAASDIVACQGRYGLLKQPPPPAARARGGDQLQVLPYRLFDMPNLAKILVGKGPRESDAMLKQARSNDLWLHIVTGTGTHVLVVYKSLKPSASIEKVQRTAAILAIHYSQYRATRAAEVYLSSRGSIKKQKGMPDGLWKIERAQTIMVHYNEDELKEILDHRTA